MKGRRKVKTNKWQITDQIIKEARAILTSRASSNGRFLDIAARSTLEEPIGMLAGSRGALHVHCPIVSEHNARQLNAT